MSSNPPSPDFVGEAPKDTSSKDTQHYEFVGPLSTAAIDPIALPTLIVRVAKKGRSWEMPRRFSTFRAVSYELLSVRGAAPKCIVRSEQDPNDWYIAKSAESWGKIETLTELLNNLLGQRLGFPMAHAGLLRADGELRFASHNFLAHNETLIHGSVLFREVFNDDLDSVGKNNWDEQRTYDVELIHAVLHQACGAAAETLFERLVEMLVFDALIGSMDRHMQNWGVIATVSEPRTYRFAPIFDSARALLWDYEEAKLKALLANRMTLDGYINRSRPKIGCATLGRAVNHFGLITHLIARYPRPTRDALRKVEPKKVTEASKLVREFPFSRLFSSERKQIIKHVLAIRADILKQTASEGR